MAIDINQATQPIIMAALASESGTIAEKTQQFKRGTQNVGAAISRKFTGRYANRLAFNRTKDKVNDAINKAVEDYQSKVLQKDMNNFAQTLKKQYGKDWMKNDEAMAEYEGKKMESLLNAQFRTQYAVRDNAQMGLDLNSGFGFDSYSNDYAFRQDKAKGIKNVHPVSDAIDAELAYNNNAGLRRVSLDLKKKDLKGLAQVDNDYIKASKQEVLDKARSIELQDKLTGGLK